MKKNNVFMAEMKDEDDGIDYGITDTHPKELPDRKTSDIETCEDLWPWLYEYLSTREVKQFNSILVDYAEFILDDPEPYGDNEINYNIKGRFSFLGHALRKTGERTHTRPYTSGLGR